MSARILSQLIVHSSSYLWFRRIGREKDGGYVVPSFNLQGVEVLYSFGVGNDWSFETQFSHETNARILMFDDTIETPPLLPTRCHLHNIGIRKSTMELDWFLNFIPSSIAGYKPRAWAKIDVEGAEWDLILASSPKAIAKFEVLIIEFHGLATGEEQLILAYSALLAKLNQSHRLIHAHGNNHGSFVMGNFGFLPDVLETTWLALDKCPLDLRRNKKAFPWMMDFPNDPTKLDYTLEGFPWTH